MIKKSYSLLGSLFEFGKFWFIREKPIMWTCDRCTFENNDDFANCKTCTANRPNSEGNNPVDNNRELPVTKWTCDRCTSENDDNNSNCMACLQQRQDTAWTCPQCTYVNEPSCPGCTMCPFVQPDNKMRRMKNYESHLHADKEKFMKYSERFECPVCFVEVGKGEGVILRDCCHTCCLLCMRGYIATSETPEIHCPLEGCTGRLEDREIRGIVDEDTYERYCRLCHRFAESQSTNSFHCKTPDCLGWVFYEDMNNFFKCPKCSRRNCLTCAAIHEDQTCLQYQDNLRIKASTDVNAKKDLAAMEALLSSGEMIKCPGCKVFIVKKEGCDWIKCTMCQIEICWATKGPRWGPAGPGDVTGGCRCHVHGRKCHPQCNNCH